ncbi:hypothetical protein [Lysinibacillus fusiformis]|uniref:hypothetical protein n=1 Tax=Lysinibacillus fusiformis TaxID=28031 RepID=UPI00263A9BEE|nr:hypothetical protein [Lysinibacillus fusiformis]MDC6266862.1 hypothetical protein [Lysinibacillus sphaericus]MDN4968878.1 hypothetical protein [Lysinibacillus fusiformis]
MTRNFPYMPSEMYPMYGEFVRNPIKRMVFSLDDFNHIATPKQLSSLCIIVNLSVNE